MKTRKILSTLLAIVFVASFVTIPALAAGTATVTGSTTVGSTLTVSFAGEDSATADTYAWSRADTSTGTGTPIDGAESATYTLVEADLGKFIFCTVTDSDEDEVESNVVGPITEAGAPGVSIDVPFTVTLAAGATVTTFTYIDEDGTEKTQTLATITDGLAALALSLTSEALVNGTEETPLFNVAGFALNGKWKKGAPTAKDIAGLFNKGGTFALTDKLDAKGKAVVKGTAGKAAEGTVEAVPGEASSVVVTFTAIQKRDKTPKLIVNYGLAGLYDDTGATAGKWTLTEKGKATAYDKLATIEYSEPADGKKLAATDTFSAFPSGGIEVKTPSETLKPGGKTVYFIQTKAYEEGGKYFPATKAIKISASALGKAPKIKPNYKVGNIGLKSGIAISRPGAAAFDLYGKTAVAGRIAVLPAKDKMPEFSAVSTATLSVGGSTIGDGSDGVIALFNYATDKKPASQIQYILLAPKASAPAAGDFSFAGKKVEMPKIVETRLLATDKWGKAKIEPGVTKSFFARTKSDAKAGAVSELNVMGSTGSAASLEVKVNVTWTKDAETGKYTAATFTLEGGEPLTGAAAKLAESTAASLAPDAVSAAYADQAAALAAVAAKAPTITGYTVTIVAADTPNFTNVDSAAGSITVKVTVTSESDPTDTASKDLTVTLPYEAE
jgi:hypothetical protein